MGDSPNRDQMFLQGRPPFVILSNVLILSSLRLCSSVGILASCKASWYEDRGYIILKARIWTRSISLDGQVERALCQITQQYSNTEGMRATQIATRSAAMTPPLHRRTQIICRRLRTPCIQSYRCAHSISDCPR